MVDKLTKALNKLDGKDKRLVKELLSCIKLGKLDGLAIKKLKGKDDLFRARQGDWRVIFIKKEGQTELVALERRGDTTYHNI